MMRITAQPAGETKFLLDGKDGKESKMVSIPEYYKSTYNLTVTKPRLVGRSSPDDGIGKADALAMCLVREEQSSPFGIRQAVGLQQHPVPQVVCKLQCLQEWNSS